MNGAMSASSTTQAERYEPAVIRREPHEEDHVQQDEPHACPPS